LRFDCRYLVWLLVLSFIFWSAFWTGATDRQKPPLTLILKNLRRADRSHELSAWHPNASFTRGRRMSASRHRWLWLHRLNVVRRLVATGHSVAVFPPGPGTGEPATSVVPIWATERI